MKDRISALLDSVVDGRRLSSADALVLFQEDKRVAELLDASRLIRLRKHGRKVHYVHSLNINPTNVCENKCDLCAFWREADDEAAYVKSLPDLRKDLEAASSMDLSDIHIVGGIIPEMNLAYYEQLFRMCKEILPGVLVQALTAVEISYLAKLEGISVKDVLQRLKDAGLGTIPGGGAEILVDGVRSEICSNKISSAEWLAVHEEAHKLGIMSNATMLFGHLEKPEHIVEHLKKLRDLQDRTGGFAAFIALPFQPGGTKLAVASAPSGHVVSKVVALARLYLDNIEHSRLLVNYIDKNLLQMLACCAVDDIGGTSLDEKIAKATGAAGDAVFASKDEMNQFIREVDLEPVFVNSRYELIGECACGEEICVASSSRHMACDFDVTRRISPDDAVTMFDELSFTELGALAAHARFERLPANMATYVVDRNISLTNICVSGCEFCAFYVEPGSDRAFTLSREHVLEKVKEAVDAGATQIMVQGGLNPELNLEYYEGLFRAIKENADVWIHSLTATEIDYLAKQTNSSYTDVLKRLVDAGLDSLPGGGAEILVDRVRRKVSPRKTTSSQWLEVMETAHSLGLKSTATMVYGLGETTSERIEHLCKVRDLQDRTGGFTAFIPWSFQSGHTRLDLAGSTGVDYLKVVSIARLVLDNIDHVQAGWVTEGPDLAQMALVFGADDFGGVLMEEQVVKATGISHQVTEKKVRQLISDLNLIPRKRNTLYGLLD